MTLEDPAGFGWPVVVTDPSGASGTLFAQAGRVGLMIDPETGVAVTGQVAHAVIRQSSLAAAGLGVPKGISDGAGKPWLVRFADVDGAARTYKVQEAQRDDHLGVVKCILEAYRTA